MRSNPPRRCPTCRGVVTDPATDDCRAVEWHLMNCLHGDDLHDALHRLLGVFTCCESGEETDDAC